jgi:hypothetical protein
MELINLYAVQGNYDEAAIFSLEVVKMIPDVILQALSLPTSPLVLSNITNVLNMESSLEL